MKIEIPESVSVTIHGLISRGVKSVSIPDTGHLIFTLTDGSEHDLGKVVGATGPKGEKGDQGDKGDTGATGPAGPQGATGAQGATGPQGETGAQGPKGDTGATGPRGLKGDSFATEVTDDGEGHIVIRTLTGEEGGTGTPGVTFTPTVSAEGVISWTNDGGLDNPAPVNIRGPAGAQGATGATGAQGPKGDPGAKGDKGDKGDTGATGAQGATGPQGPAGATPVKGTDYFTDADKAELVTQVIAALPDGDEVSY